MVMRDWSVNSVRIVFWLRGRVKEEVSLKVERQTGRKEEKRAHMATSVSTSTELVASSSTMIL